MMHRTFLAVITGFLLSSASPQTDSICARGAPLLCLRFSPEIIQTLPGDFAFGAARQISESLREINYCVRVCENRVSERDSALLGAIVVRIGLDSLSGDSSPAIEVSFAVLDDLTADLDYLPEARTLVRFPLTSDYSDVHSVLATKVVEDFRTHYLCHLHISTVPAGAEVVTESGLTGTTPLEWVLPVGALPVRVTKEKCRKLSTTVRLDRPGDHTVVLNLEKKRFYNSAFIYPLAISLAASGALFAAEAYFYRDYRKLGKEDYYSRPESFGRAFEKAQTLEYAAFAALVSSGAFFALSLRF